MKCHGCNQDKKLIKAHIIPESFFRGLKSDDKGPLLVADEQKFPKKAPLGVYDKQILCHDCEQKFQEVDHYGQEIFLKRKHKQYNHKGVDYFILKNINYKLIKLFLLSILWRASISTHPYYSHVILGKYETQIKEMIWSYNPGEPEEFSFVLAKFTDDHLGSAMLNPRRIRFSAINYYIIYLFGFIAYIKVDKRGTFKDFLPLIMLKDQDIVVTGRDIHNSKEIKAMWEVVNNKRSI